LSCVTEGNTLTFIRLTDGVIAYLVKNPNTYNSNLAIFREEAFKTEQKFVVEGVLDGFEVSKTFETKYSAEQFVRELDGDKAKSLSVVEKQVRVDVGPASQTNNSDVPF
jgi:hypothetical protein